MTQPSDKEVEGIIKGMSTMIRMLAPEKREQRGLFGLACVHAGIQLLVESKTVDADQLRRMLEQQLEESLKAVTSEVTDE